MLFKFKVVIEWFGVTCEYKVRANTALGIVSSVRSLGKRGINWCAYITRLLQPICNNCCVLVLADKLLEGDES